MFRNKKLQITQHAKERYRERVFRQHKKGAVMGILQDLTRFKNIRRIEHIETSKGKEYHVHCHGMRRYVVAEQGSKYIVLTVVQHTRKSNKFRVLQGDKNSPIYFQKSVDFKKGVCYNRDRPRGKGREPRGKRKWNREIRLVWRTGLLSENGSGPFCLTILGVRPRTLFCINYHTHLKKSMGILNYFATFIFSQKSY